MSSFSNEIWLAIRTDVADGLGTGTPSDPYAANTSESFAAIMNDPAKIGPNSLIRLGPGVFRTRGTAGNGFAMQSGRWSPQEGQRITGAGMFATTLIFDWDQVLTGSPGQRHPMITSTVT